MELRIRDRKLPKNRIISNSLKTVYGIGRERAIYICACLGIGLHFSINLLNGYLFNCIIVIIKLFFIIEDRLKDLIQQKYEYLYKLKLWKGFRIFKGLPVHGQHTHTNRKTTQRLKPQLLNVELNETKDETKIVKSTMKFFKNKSKKIKNIYNEESWDYKT